MVMALTLQGKVALITGASRSRGIGAQVAYELARRGAKASEQQWGIFILYLHS